MSEEAKIVLVIGVVLGYCIGRVVGLLLEAAGPRDSAVWWYVLAYSAGAALLSVVAAWMNLQAQNVR